MPSGESLMDKETLSLYKIKRDLKQIISWQSAWLFILLIVILLLGLALGLLAVKIPLSILGYAIFAIILLPIIIIFITQAAKTFDLIIKVHKGKIKIETDELISKNESKEGYLRYGIWYILQGDTYVYRLFFKCNEKFELPFHKCYKWSSQHAMRPRGIFITSDIGDTFTIVKINNQILMVYNNKLFQPSPALL